MDKKVMLEFFFNNNSFNALAQEISASLSCPIVITDNAFHIISSVSSIEYGDPIYKTAISHSKLSEETCMHIATKVEEGINHFCVQSGENNFCVGILKNSDTIIGYILYFLDIEMFDEHDLFFCEGLLSKQLFLERYCCSSSLSTAEEILIDLLNGEYSCENIFDTQISGTFLSHFSPKRFAVVFFSSINEFEEKHATVLRKCKDYFHASHPFVYKDKIILFLHKDHDINQVEDIVKSLQLNVMISEDLDKLYVMDKHYNRMCTIRDFLSEKSKLKQVTYEHSYSVLIYLLHLKQNNYQIDKNISSLLYHDLNNNTDFCLTLYTYIICNHSLKKTAENLHAHSNTVLYRIQKAKDEFEIDTDNLELHFYYLISLALCLLELGHEDIFILSDK